MNNTLQNWIPYKITDADAEPLCYWLNTFNIRFTEPFFDSTISCCKSLNNNRFRSVGTLDLLEQWAINMDHIEPTAFIFQGLPIYMAIKGIFCAAMATREVPAGKGGAGMWLN